MKVLVVEDNQSMSDLIEIALVREKFSIDRAFDGVTAFEKAKQHKYDLIILDIVLPKQSGFYVISALRALGNDTPILAISGDRLVSSRVRALNMGADDFIVKDFSFDEFLARVKTLLRRQSGKRSNVFRSKDLVLNLTDMTVSYKGDGIVLTKKEFQILLLLLRNKNSVVTREQLLSALWNTPNNARSNTIDVHIRTLRRKLGDGGDVIETVRGSGYIVRG